ncbi:MAG TPA: hypothetical protein VMT73_12130 [Anaerolineales bacterium]|nr:hypothetical protein [Anaerolineales bacterium]
MRRSSFLFGVILLFLGALLFADSAGFRLPGGARLSEFFWPIVLIFAGAWIIFGVLTRSKPETEQASVDLQGAREATVRLSHGAGELKISSGAGAGQLANGKFVGGLVQHSRRFGDGLEVKMRPPHEPFNFFNGFERYDWNVHFNSDVPLALKLSTGADNAQIDLRDLRVTSLKLETGASQTKVTFPARGRLTADFDLGAAGLELIVPDGVSARIRVSQGVSSVNVDESRFPRVGGIYKSPDFESATNAIDMTIDAGAADIKIR